MGDPSRVKVIGPLVPFVSGFRAELEGQGYRRGLVCDQLRLMAHVSRWLAARGLDVDDLASSRVDEFLMARRAEGYTLWRSAKGLAPLLAYLRGLGVLPTPELPADSPVRDLLDRYLAYLVEERGLAVGTVTGYLHVARLFLASRSEVPGLGLESLTPGEVIEFVVAECRQRSRGSAKFIVCGLRALLRFCYLEGLTERPLAAAVPTVANWRLAPLPNALTADEVAALLASCDRRTTFGRRDFAVLTLLARLGLRAGEVAGLCLEDVEWRGGELVVRGKGPKEERLPLPADVGEAIAGWLQRGRPRCTAREVFTRIRAPHHRLTPGGVSAIVRAACARAGVVEVNAHRLRHSAATEMLRAGASLGEIGQVLRHHSVLSTAIYAKVDRVSLRALAKPWPADGAVSR
jgi:site-specific recombinase XerD